jgi:hypothetical protein
LDDNIRRWILRVRFNSIGMKIELNDEKHTVYELESPIDIYNHADEIINVVEKFL